MSFFKKEIQLTLKHPPGSREAAVVLGHAYGTDRHCFVGNWCDSLASNGYLAVAIEYDDIDQPNGLFPKPVRAFKTAVEFLRSNAGRFGIVPDRIIGLGQSQGSFIWGESIAWDNDDGYFGTDPLVNDHLFAAVLFYGLYDTENYVPFADAILDIYFDQNDSVRSGKGNPIANACNVTTPVLLLHGTIDGIAPFIQSQQYCDSLQTCENPCQLIPFPGDHVFDVPTCNEFSPLGLSALDTVLQFLDMVTSVHEFAGSGRATSWFLGQNFPNPFNPTTTIHYRVSHRSFVSLTIFNVLGQEMSRLVNERLDPGTYEARLDGAHLPSGVYLYQLKADDFTEIKKMILLR